MYRDLSDFYLSICLFSLSYSDVYVFQLKQILKLHAVQSYAELLQSKGS